MYTPRQRIKYTRNNTEIKYTRKIIKFPSTKSFLYAFFRGAFVNTSNTN